MRTKLLLFVFFLLALGACQQQNKTTESEDQSEPQVSSASLTDEEISEYRDKGQAIALSVFTTMSGQLQTAMQEGGVAQAVQHCNLVAMPLVDSLSKVHNATIKRTTFKTRNPDDTPTAEERAMLEKYQAIKEAGEPLTPTVVRQGEHIAFYAPIGMQPLCLKCHGTVGETIAEADYELIKKHYPEDQAIGYQDGDLRGMWSIVFN